MANYLPSTRRRGFRGAIFYQCVSAIIGGCVTASLDLLVALAIKTSARGTLISVGLSFLVGLVIGVLVGTLLDFSKALTDAQSLLEDIHQTWPYHKQLVAVLNKHRRHEEFVEHLLKESTVDKMLQIPSVQDFQFYKLLMDALRYCRKWDGIHHGAISRLGYDQFRLQYASKNSDNGRYAYWGELYFNSLSRAVEEKRVIARRVIILPSEFLWELEDYDIMKAFWDKTGNQVDSYWLSEDNPEILRRMAGMTLDDAALHDGQLYLQYDRELQTVRFDESERMRLIKDIFTELDEFMNDRGVNPLGFKKLTGPGLPSRRGKH